MITIMTAIILVIVTIAETETTTEAEVATTIARPLATQVGIIGTVGATHTEIITTARDK